MDPQPEVTPTPQSSVNKPLLSLSTREGAYSAFMLGAGESYIGAFGVFLQGSAFLVGVLSALPPFIGAICNGFGLWLLENIKSRRRLMGIGALLQAIIWLPIAFLPWMLTSGNHAVATLVILYTCYHILGGIVSPAWTSLIGDLVTPDTRGKFFSHRSRIASLATFLGLLLGGVVLQFSRSYQHAAWGFATIFLLACVARVLSSQLLLQHPDLPHHVGREHHFTLYLFLKRLPQSNFARFVIFSSAMLSAQALSGPYFVVYMLRDLHLSYYQFTLITATAILAQFVTFKNWGEISDRYGNRRILIFCSAGMVLSPFLWLVNASFWYLMLIQLYSGFIMAGFNLATTNFILDAVTAPKRARCVAYHATVSGAGICVASLVGGLLLPQLELLKINFFWLPEPLSPFLTLFIVSGALRLLAFVIFIPHFKEVREVTKVSMRNFIFEVTHLRPISGATFSFVGFPRKR